MSAKVAVVTGATSGIGLATAELFVDRGFEVFALGRNKVMLQALANRGCHPVSVDLADPNQIHAAVAEINSDTDGLDVLVNNAGVTELRKIEDICLESFDFHFQCNVRAPILLVQLLLDRLVARHGSVVNITSAVTRYPGPYQSLYVATKAALEGFTLGATAELARRGVRISCVAPGLVRTPIFEKLGDEAYIESSKQAIPIGRIGDPAEIAEIVYDVARASYVTGTTWFVDGGFSAAMPAV